MKARLNPLRVLLAVGSGAFCLAQQRPALANDSSAHMAAGGLVLSQTSAIEMRSEDLYVSRKRIRVKYSLRNITDRDVITLVAFPMPELTVPFDGDLSIPSDDPVNFLDFATRVNGKPAEVKAEQRALALGLDHTELLTGMAIPLAPHLVATATALDALEPQQQARLLQSGLIAYDEYDAGKGWERHARPLWSLKTTYYWSQIFPAKSDTVIEHDYTPSVGASVQTFIGSDFSDAKSLADYKARYCLEDNFIAAARRKQRAKGATLSEWRIGYVLTTGANWAGPIGEFTLTVDKGDKDNLVSFCASGVNKTGPTRFEVRYKDYIPERDLDVLILAPVRTE